MAGPSLVSVIIPTYNRAGTIAAAIRSVQEQTYAPVEIIVVDDGSTDDTRSVMAGFGEAVTYVRQPHTGQPAATRNAGLRVARGVFCALLDSDDLYLPDKLALQVAALSVHPDVGLVYSDGRFFRHDPAQPAGRVLDGLPSPSGDVFPELLRGNFLSTPTVLIRRLCLDAVGLFDERPDFLAVEDYDLWLRIAAQFPVLYVPGDVAAIRRHGGSISRDVAALRQRMLLVLARMEDLYPALMQRHRATCHEAYARSHGAIALANLSQARVVPGMLHGLRALAHAVRTPRLGSAVFAAWWRRRRKRQGARP